MHIMRLFVSTPCTMINATISTHMWVFLTWRKIGLTVFEQYNNYRLSHGYVMNVMKATYLGYTFETGVDTSFISLDM